MSAVNRFKQIAQLIGTIVILVTIGLAAGLLYVWWDSRQETRAHDPDSSSAVNDSMKSDPDEIGAESSDPDTADTDATTA